VQHDCYGKYLVVDELVCFKREVIWVDYGPPDDPKPDFQYETGVKAIVKKWNPAMLVFYIGLWLPVHRKVNHLYGNSAQILELYDNDEVGHVRKNKSVHMHA
jgi:hypothetical protein